MPNYKKMYHIMFNAATDAERLLGEATEASRILREAQQECEELYIERRQAAAPITRVCLLLIQSASPANWDEP